MGDIRDDAIDSYPRHIFCLFATSFVARQFIVRVVQMCRVGLNLAVEVCRVHTPQFLVRVVQMCR